MSSKPVICFGQQPCGFFPKRFLVAKIQTARRLQKEIGGEIVFKSEKPTSTPPGQHADQLKSYADNSF